MAISSEQIYAGLGVPASWSLSEMAEPISPDSLLSGLCLSLSKVVVSQVPLCAPLTSLLFWENGSWGGAVYVIIKAIELQPTREQGGNHLASPLLYLNIADL